MIYGRLWTGLFLLASVGIAGAQTFVGPTPYLSAADSPWTGSPGFVLEDFEDGVFNPAGVTISAGTSFQGPGGITDSVDGDDGAIDGSGRDGRSLFSGSGNPGIRFTFDATVLGGLPTRAGIVWTDGGGNAPIRFEAFGANGASLGVVNGAHADGSNSSETAEDRFYGVIHTGGIASILIGNGSGGIEVDHFQFVAPSAVPEPATLAALGLGAAAMLRRRRRA